MHTVFRCIRKSSGPAGAHRTPDSKVLGSNPSVSEIRLHARVKCVQLLYGTSIIRTIWENGICVAQLQMNITDLLEYNFIFKRTHSVRKMYE